MRHDVKQSKYDWYEYLLVGMICIPNILRLFISINTHFISSDAIQFVTLGYNYFHSCIYSSPFGIVPDWIQSPIFPLFIGFFSTFISIHSAGFIACEISVFAIYSLLYYFVSKNFNHKMALLTIAILSFNPVIFYISGRLTAEVLFVPLNLLIFLILYFYYQHKEKLSYKIVIILSILNVLLWLIRVEGVLFFCISALIVLKIGNLKKVLFYVIISMLLITPYGLFIQNKSGNFSLIPKIVYNSRLGVVAQKLKTEKNQSNYKIEDIQEYVWYAYDSEEGAFYSEKIMDDEYFGKLKKDLSIIQKNETRKFTLPGLVYNNILDIIRAFIRSFAFPILFLISIILGIYYFIQNDKRLLGMMVFWNIASFYFIISHVEFRFFAVMLPYFSIIAAYGLNSAFSRYSFKNIIISIFMILFMINSSFYWYDYYQLQNKRENLFDVSKEGNEIVSSDDIVCSRMPHISFYSGIDYIKLPICTNDELKKYLKKNNAKYLILSNEVFTSRKSFYSIYSGQDKEFEHIRTLSYPNEDFKIFKLL